MRAHRRPLCKPPLGPPPPAAAAAAAAKQDGLGILNVTHELCGGQTHVRGNGEVGGWVAPQLPQQLAGG